MKRKPGVDDEVPQDIEKASNKWLVGIKKMNEFKLTDLVVIMVGSFHISTYISSVMHLNQGMGQWLIFVLLLKVKLLTVALSWKSLDLPKSVPRLELNAAVINSSILLFTKLTCQLKKTIFWSGSMLTLQYIQDKSHRNHTCKHIQRGELSEEYS